MIGFEGERERERTTLGGDWKWEGELCRVWNSILWVCPSLIVKSVWQNESERECMRERGSVWERDRVYERKRETECMREWEREREREMGNLLVGVAALLLILQRRDWSHNWEWTTDTLFNLSLFRLCLFICLSVHFPNASLFVYHVLHNL